MIGMETIVGKSSLASGGQPTRLLLTTTSNFFVGQRNLALRDAILFLMAAQDNSLTEYQEEIQRMYNHRVTISITVLAAVLYFDINPQAITTKCSIIPYKHYWIASKRIVTPKGVISGAVEVKGGKIISVVEEDDWRENARSKHIINYGEAVIMPGLIDVHAHLDDPGRAEWEGFPSGTMAAAAGGITTLIDMPLNSFPSTVSEETLKLKTNAAKGRIFVDVGFWGGLVPENAFNATSLECLLKAGALGLKVCSCTSDG
ncbi:unnamed protein product [Fraxinus pennsylvanica]|uniref:Allantoinase n=1 Tax=Fraxinus pennsylvanica TaxID=56036 RepID=A0AAD2A997_9LAMI|nr:unnamed protein product [Fraxinus pennsylvanica]